MERIVRGDVPAKHHIAVYNAALFQQLGADGERYECHSLETLKSRRLRLMVDAHGARGVKPDVFKVDDPNMPSDFLTKWVPAPKLRQSLAYATNTRSRV